MKYSVNALAFLNAMRESGIVLNEPLMADGLLHIPPQEGDGFIESGWYAFFEEKDEAYGCYGVNGSTKMWPYEADDERATKKAKMHCLATSRQLIVHLRETIDDLSSVAEWIFDSLDDVGSGHPFIADMKIDPKCVKSIGDSFLFMERDGDKVINYTFLENHNGRDLASQESKAFRFESYDFDELLKKVDRKLWEYGVEMFPDFLEGVRQECDGGIH